MFNIKEKKDFVSPEVAELMNKKGCNIVNHTNINNLPSLYEAQKWFREIYNVEVNATWDPYEDKWFYYYQEFYDLPCNSNPGESKYDSYEEALNEGIKEVLTFCFSDK